MTGPNYCDFNKVNPYDWKFNKQDTKNSNSFQGPNIWINDTSRQPIQFQLSVGKNDLAVAPYGVSKLMPGTQDTGRYNMKLRIENEDLIEKIKEIDSVIKKQAVESFGDWFKKSMTEAEANIFYRSPLQCSEDNKYYIKVKVSKPLDSADYKTNATKVEKYVSEEDGNPGVTEPGELDDIIPQSRLMVAVKINKLWCMQSREFGVSLNVRHALVFPGDQQVCVPCDMYLGEDEETGQEIEKVYVPTDQVNNKHKLDDDVIGEGFKDDNNAKRPRLD